MTTEYRKFEEQPQDHDVPATELDDMVLHLHADGFSPTDSSISGARCSTRGSADFTFERSSRPET